MIGVSAARPGGRRRILLYADGVREWAALTVGGRLEDLYAEDLGRYTGPRLGQICAARIDRLSAGGGAAFVDLGGGHDGFLTQAAGLAAGDGVLVQVDRFSQGNKEARVTRAVSVSGRWLVLVAARAGVRISRRIADPALREELEDQLAPFAEDARIVVRTAAAAADPEAIAAEAQALHGRLAELEGIAAAGPAKPLVPAPGPAARGLDRWLTGGPAEIIGAGTALATALTEGPPAEVTEAEDENALLRIDELDDQIRGLHRPRVELGGGAWISVEPTEALVAVDVNTGAAGIGRAGLQAAREIPRQLRLRGLGGITVIDFPRGSDEDEERVEQALDEALREEGGRAFGWTRTGLYELVRTRDRRPPGECFRPGM